MTQEDLIDYVLAYDCYIYDEKDRWDGHAYFVRKNNTTNIAVIFKPKKGKYMAVAVCHICNTLEVPVPDYAKDAQEIINEAKKNLPPGC